MSNFRVTVRGNNVELRGFVDSYDGLAALANAVEPFGWIVIGSVAEDAESTPIRLFQDNYRWRE